MKRFMLLFSVSLLLLSVGCSESAIKPAASREQCTVAEFMDLYADYMKANGRAVITHNETMTEEENKIYFTPTDITPEQVYQEIGCKVFKVNSSCETYIVSGQTIYPIGTGFGGWGIVQMETCDFNSDGQKDLIYTYSWGSGMHRSLLAVFDFTMMKETQLDFVLPNKDMALEKVSDREFHVFEASVIPKNHFNYSNLEITRANQIATVVSKNKAAVISPIQ